jgi:hypothetical protein
LIEIEQIWSVARDQLATAMTAAQLHLESGHWDWRNKAEPEGVSEHRLIAIECDGEIQGLMALSASPRAARLLPGEAVVYVDYLEAAPWNLRQPVQAPRYLGVGTLLISEAIRQSFHLGLGGRVGLHSLPQAERFYADRCRMTFHGNDQDYYNLAYFEYGKGDAVRWLTDIGLIQ